MPTKAQLIDDVDFLLARAAFAGRVYFSGDRDYGVSSNALVRLAYGGKPPMRREYPYDHSDLAACERALASLPRHRRGCLVDSAFKKMERALIKRESAPRARAQGVGAVMRHPTLNSDGYPTEETLARIPEWPPSEGWPQLFDFIREAWRNDNLWEQVGETHEVSTGGWSGNEDMIDALQKNRAAWSVCFRSVAPGGHYVFEVPEAEEEG